MFKRTTLVTKHPGLTRARFEALWLGEHVEYARQLPGLREYAIDFVVNPAPGDPDGIATVRFDSRQACEDAFATPGLDADLSRTRDTFASAVRVLYVRERVIHRDGQE